MTPGTHQQPHVSAGLDVVRATAMLLGLGYHACFAYMPDIAQWYVVQDPSTSWLFVALSGLLHAVRMQIFFALSGYLAWKLLERKGLKAFAVNRVRRILVPLAAALPIVMTLDFVLRNWATDLGRASSTYLDGAHWAFRPRHLWFLEYVAVFSALLLLVRKLPMRQVAPEWLVVLTIPTALGVQFLGEPKPGFTLALEWPVLMHFALFFAVGVLVAHTTRGHELDAMKHCRWMLIAALVLGLGVYSTELQWRPVGIWLGALTGWLAVLGAFGWASWPFQVSHVRAVLVDASYWIYLVHYPLVMTAHILLVPVALPALVKWGLTVTAALTIALVSYFALVRHTPLRHVLGGHSARAR